jgi:hypothetical protein
MAGHLIEDFLGFIKVATGLLLIEHKPHLLGTSIHGCFLGRRTPSSKIRYISHPSISSTHCIVLGFVYP